jgi:uncharacterized protein (TIGR02145 family)
VRLSLPDPEFITYHLKNFINMTKKAILLALMLIMMGAASVNAQVRIGGLDNPNSSAVLDLNATDAANNGELGLALPRVELTSTIDFAPLQAHVAGMIVYNTATADDVTPGTYYNDGSKWVRLGNGTLIGAADGGLTVASPLSTSDPYTVSIANGGVITAKIADKAVTAAKLADGVLASTAAPIITTQPKSFSWSRMKDSNGDPNSTVTSFSPTLTITASGSGLSYKWYKKAVNRNAADTFIATATTNSYAPVLTAWGMDSYYCVVSNTYGSVTSNIADVAAGCGAKTADGGWLKFMCHNLGASLVGATQSLDAITFGSGTAATDSTSSDAKGWLFQWGRAADGHHWRSSATVAGPVALSGANQVASGTATYGKFITNGEYPYDWRTPQYDQLWRNWNDGRFPCPSGWKVPSSWGALYRSGSTYGAPGQATANTWVWVNKGYAIRPDGVTTTLFLPAAGYHHSNNSTVLTDVGTYGLYWSSTAVSSGVHYLLFHSPSVSPEANSRRANGFSVRCIAE